MIQSDPQRSQVASVSVGIFEGNAILDLDYIEDSQAETDMNLVMNGEGDFIEVQGTAEGHPFSGGEMEKMLEIGRTGIRQLIDIQKHALELV